MVSTGFRPWTSIIMTNLQPSHGDSALEDGVDNVADDMMLPVGENVAAQICCPRFQVLRRIIRRLDNLM